MPRVARSKLQASFFHVMVQGINKEYIFNTEVYMKKYERLMKTYLKNFNIKLVAYCIMNNHAHILIYTEDLNEMSKYMKSINTSFAMYYNKQKKRVGIVFRNRYESEPIYNRSHLINCISYIHNNPVKAGIIRFPRQYKYSSYTDYITGLIDDDILKLVFGCTDGYLETFELIHKNNMYEDFMDYEEFDYNQRIEKIIQDNNSNVFMDKILFNKMIKNLIIDNKIPIKIISEKFNLSRYKISKILKS